MSQTWKRNILFFLLFVVFGFLGVISWQTQGTPSKGAPLLSIDAIWPTHAAWWAKTGMWVAIALFGLLFHRWKSKTQ
jgi:hypothetical protein